MSVCEWTDTNSPAAIDIAPAASPAMPASRIVGRSPVAVAIPTISELTETIPSLAPITAARSQFERLMRCGASGWADGSSLYSVTFGSPCRNGRPGDPRHASAGWRAGQSPIERVSSFGVSVWSTGL